jgi:hypothetical protein
VSLLKAGVCLLITGVFVKMSGITNSFPDRNKPSQPPLKREEHQEIRVSQKLKSKTNEKQNKRTKLSIFHNLTPLFPREGQG